MTYLSTSGIGKVHGQTKIGGIYITQSYPLCYFKVLLPLTSINLKSETPLFSLGGDTAVPAKKILSENYRSEAIFWRMKQATPQWVDDAMLLRNAKK